MKLPTLSRGAFTRIVLGAAIGLPPLRTPATPAAPTFSLKGIPGINAITGADEPRPDSELGVIGKGKDGVKSGRLQFCERKGCISSFSNPEDASYVPPWTYSPDDVMAQSSYSSARARLLATEEGGVARPKKSIEQAQAELRDVLKASDGATLIKDQPRYLYAEFEDAASGATDDVEFLFSSDSAIVGYRSATRKGGDDKRQRERVRTIRKALASKGWRSVGRLQVD